jgi:hypothetical protein
MRPTDLKRELERLTVDASQARSQLGGLRSKLGEVRSIVSEMRTALGVGASKPTEAESTSAARRAQGEAGPS